MQTIKTAVVVVLLLFVLYGGYVALKGTDAPLPEELQTLVGVDETVPDVSGPASLAPAPSAALGAASGNAFERFASLPAPSFGSSNPPAFPAAPASTPKAAGSLPTDIPDLELPSSDAGRGDLPSAPELPAATNPPPTLNASATGPSAGLPGVPPLGGNASGDTASQGARDDRKVPAMSTSAKSDPGFGLALPSLTPSENALAPKSGGVPPSNPPPLDLPSVHGGADNLADVTKPREATSESSGGPAIPATTPSRSYENAKSLAMRHVDENKLKEALATLSVFYNAQELTTDQRTDLLDLLDALAREVVYSRRHHLDFAYVVAPGETLEQISKQYNVPSEILARINGLEANTEPPSGTQLKIVPGPFRAEVDLTRQELTLFLGELYAGRYPVSFGSEPEAKPGIYQVLDKQRGRNYYGSTGATIAAGDPTNPFGGCWIDLGQNLCIHGSPDSQSGPTQLGCISLSPLDASDVFGMLGRSSQVTIRR